MLTWLGERKDFRCKRKVERGCVTLGSLSCVPQGRGTPRGASGTSCLLGEMKPIFTINDGGWTLFCHIHHCSL